MCIFEINKNEIFIDIEVIKVDGFYYNCFNKYWINFKYGLKKGIKIVNFEILCFFIYKLNKMV